MVRHGDMEMRNRRVRETYVTPALMLNIKTGSQEYTEYILRLECRQFTHTRPQQPSVLGEAIVHWGCVHALLQVLQLYTELRRVP